MTETLRPKKKINLYNKLIEAGPHTLGDFDTGKVVISGELYVATHVKITNALFTDVVEISEVNLNNGIIFENCEFKSAVKFTKVRSKKHKDNQHPEFGNIEFRKCRLSERLIIKGLESSGDLIFEECIFEKGLILSNINLLDGSVYIYDCDIKQVLDVLSCHIPGEIMVSSNKIGGQCRLLDLICRGIGFFDGNTVNAELLIDKCVMSDGISFFNSQFSNDVNLDENVTTHSGLKIVDSKFEKAFNVNFQLSTEFTRKGIRSIDIAASEFSNGFNVIGSKSFGKSFPEMLECKISTSSALKGNLSFSAIKIHHLTISGYNSAAKISLSHLHLKELTVAEFINEGGLMFSNVRAWDGVIDEGDSPQSSVLSVSDTNFGKAQFFQTDFGSFSDVYVNNVILSEVSTIAVNWFTTYQLEGDHFANYVRELNRAIKTKQTTLIEITRQSLITWLNSNREIYRQLKYASQRQADIPQSHIFQAMEMKLYRQITKYQRPVNWSERLILISSLSNDFGQNWLRAFKLLILCSIVVYIPIGLLSSDLLDHSRIATTWADLVINFRILFYDNIKFLFVILNPAHRVTDFKLGEISFWLYFWDIISRIVVSYFLFQTISAFRKFSK
jgi:hypothetical protein